MKKILLFLMLALFCIPWAANAQNTLTVHDGTTTNAYVPIYGYYADAYLKCQMVYPASELTAMNGQAITAMSFYTSQTDLSGLDGTFQVWIKEVDDATLSAFVSTDDATLVYEGTVSTNGEMAIVFEEAYTYNGGNLFVGVYQTATSSAYPTTSFYGEEVTSAAFQGYSYSGINSVTGSVKNFLPKTTFTYETASSCTKPTDLTYLYTEGETTATVSWTSDAGAFNVDVNGTITAVTTNTYTINIQPATTYTIKVQANCGEEQSGWASTSFFSGCPASFAIPYTYGFENAEAFTCWTVNATGDYPASTGINTGYPKTGTNSFRFYYTEEPGQYLISPELSGITNGLHVEFWYRQYEYGAETFHVGYSTTTNDVDAFTWGEEISASTTYQRFSANYPAGTKYVAVKHTSDDQYYLYLDDFLFEESASCLEPTNVHYADVTTTSASISWTPGASETAWDIYVTDDEDDVPGETTSITITNVEDNPYTLTNLTPATTYYVYVRALCGETDASAWSSPVIFDTKCEAMELPYSEDFLSSDSKWMCWNTIVSNTSYDGISIVGLSNPAINVIQFYRGAQGGNIVAVLPEVDAAYPLNGYQITFDAAYSYNSGTLTVGVMTDPTDASTFVAVEQITPTSSLASYTVRLNTYSGNGQYIALKHAGTSTSSYIYVGNIEVTELPACLTPENLTVTGAKNAVVTWEGEGSFQIALTLDPEVDPDDAIVVTEITDNEYDLSSLTTEGMHYVYVRTDCGDAGYSAWVGTSFDVNYCTPNPTSHDGNGITGVSFGTGDNVVTNGDGSASLPASAPYYGDYTSMIGAVQAGVESTIAITTSTGNYPYTFVIWVDLDNSMSFEDSEILYIGKASSGAGTLNATITIPATQTLGDYRMRIYGADSYFTSFYGNGTTNWNADHDPCSSGTYRHAHDYTLRVLEAPSCLAAGNVAVATENITPTTAVISWINNNGAEATYTVMQGETVLTTNAVDSYTLTGLTAATTYPAGTFTIISDCDETLIANVPAFTTQCGNITTFPWTANFEDMTANTVPLCWDNSASTTSTTTSYYIWGVYTYNENKMLRMYNFMVQSGTALINSPNIELPDEGVYQLTFDYSNLANCGAFTVKISEDGGTTFTDLQSYAAAGSTNSTDPGTFTEADPINLAAYAGKTVVLQFFANANYVSGAIFVDNIVVEEAPSCLKPTELSATAATNSAELSWTANSEETAWTLYWKVSGADTYTEVTGVTDNPYTLNGLNAATTYEYYVIANCSADDASEASAVYEFATECELITITAETPYTQDFEAPVVTTTYSEVGQMPACWDNYPATNASAKILKAGASYNYADEGQVLYFYGSGNNYAALPKFTNALNTLQITFKRATESSSNGTLTLGYITDEDYSTFTEIETFAASSESYQALKEETVELNNVPATATRLVFRWYYSGQWGCNIDDVTVGVLPPCGIVLNEANNYTWTEDFETMAAGITEPWTGVEPTCWTLVEQYSSASMNHVGEETDTLPQVFYYPEFDAADGNYTLRMKYRSLLAMPELDGTVDMSRLHLSMYVRQPKGYYKLLVGVWDEATNVFDSLFVVDNQSTNMEKFECDFSRYEGNGRYIAFKNVGGSSSNPHCSNYLDSIKLTYAQPVNCDGITVGDPEGFETYTTNAGATGVEPDCWEVIKEERSLSISTKPQIYAGFNTTEGGNYTLRMRNRCVYAMPEFADDVDISTLTMTFQLRQPKAAYMLQVGVVDAEGNFEMVEEINNATTEMEEVSVDFTGHPGTRIAFRNVLNGRHYDYSYNYIDDISFTVNTAKVSANDGSDMDVERYLDNIAVYPNPTTGMLHIDAVDVQKVECYNQMGQLVGVYDNANELNISELSNGVYMLRITVPQGVTMRKVVKR